MVCPYITYGIKFSVILCKTHKHTFSSPSTHDVCLFFLRIDLFCFCLKKTQAFSISQNHAVHSYGESFVSVRLCSSMLESISFDRFSLNKIAVHDFVYPSFFIVLDVVDDAKIH